MKNVHPNYACQHCGVKKKTINSLKNHIEAEHKESIPCPECGVIYKTQASLNQHIKRVHSDQSALQCSRCDYKTNITGDMKAHYERTHTEIGQETCEFCGEVFKNLKNHLERTGCGQEGESVSCHYCGKHYPTKVACQFHISWKHEKIRKEEACEFCGKCVINLKRHLQNTSCGKSNVQKKKVSCTMCDKTFSNTDAMKTHIKRIHENIRDKVCQQCSYTTYCNYNLRLHVTKMHQSKA